MISTEYQEPPYKAHEPQSEPAMPDFGLIVTLLDHWGWRGLSKDLRAWLAQREQPAAAEGDQADDLPASMYGLVNKPAPAEGGAVSEAVGFDVVRQWLDEYADILQITGADDADECRAVARSVGQYGIAGDQWWPATNAQDQDCFVRRVDGKWYHCRLQKGGDAEHAALIKTATIAVCDAALGAQESP